MPESKKLAIQELSKISELSSSGEGELKKDIKSIFQSILQEIGYKRENLFNDFELETPKSVRRGTGYGTILFDIIAADKPTSPPHLSIVIDPSWKIHHEGEVTGFLSQFMLGCRVTSRSEYSLLVTDTHAVILGQEYAPKAYALEESEDGGVEKLVEQISPPEEYPKGRSGRFPPGYHPDQTKLTRWLFEDSEITPEYQSEINTEFFSLDIDEYSEILYDAYSATSTTEKGDRLEDVAEFLFSNLFMVNVRDRNLRTKSGEIDLVLEYQGFGKHNIFEYLSRFILVECKNEASSVSSKEVGYFLTKVRDSGNDLGIIIAWNGISGEETGENARRIVDISSNQTYVVVLDSNDLYSILDGESLYKMLDEKLYELQFDVKNSN
jgi:hypothetical protein